jgi:toxin CcdB
VVSTRFDVFRNPTGSKSHPFLVVVQHEVLDRLPTRLVIPLVRKEQLEGLPITRLNPSWTVERTQVVLLTQQLGAVRAATLTRRVGSLADRRADILGAIDVLLSGV